MLVQSDTFATMPVIRFRTDVRARPYQYGRDRLETIVDLPGDYVFPVGEQMGGEHAHWNSGQTPSI
jgi:hypothetical protein